LYGLERIFGYDQPIICRKKIEDFFGKASFSQVRRSIANFVAD